MYFLDLNFFVGGIRVIMAVLCGFVYPLVGWLFNLFMNVAKVSILGDAQIKPIYQRITMILTIVMIFYVTFEFVKYIVQPDGITDKEKGVGNIVYKMILVVVLIAFVPTIFSYAYKLQGAIMDNGLIGNVIIGKANVEPDKLGSTFSANLLSLFYSVDEKYIEEDCGGVDCGLLVQMNLSALQQTGDLASMTVGMDASIEEETSIEGEEIEIPLIDFTFNGLLPVVVGIFVGYILVIYCIDLGTRWAQLVFLQIIAPIPIIGYLSPKKDGIFQKWCKQCLTTYLDLFIRTALIYFVLLITSVLMDGFRNGNLLQNVDKDLAIFVYIVLILGVMLFLQKAPKMLKELFPSTNAASGNFGLKAGERVAPMAARAIGAGLGATRALTGAIGRARAASQRKKAAGLDTKEGRNRHKQELGQRRAARREAAEAEKRQRKYGAAYESANKDNIEKKAALDKAGREYTDARKARMQAEAEGKPKAEIDRLKANEAEARKKVEAASAAYKPTIAVKNDLKEKVMGEKAYAEEKERRRQEAIEAGKAREQLKEQRETLETATGEAEAARQTFETLNTQLSQAEKEEKAAEKVVTEARERVETATSNEAKATQERDAIRGEISKIEAELSGAKAAGLTDPNEIAKMEGKISALRQQENAAQARITSAQQAKNQAIADESRANSELTTKKQNMESIKRNTNEAAAKKEAAERTERDAASTKSATEAAIRNKLDAMKMTAAPTDHKNTLEHLENERRQKEDEEKEEKYKKRGTSVIGGTVGGVLSGGYTGITHGAKATKLEDIGKKVSEGYQADIKAIDAVQKYYDEGGAKTWVGRTIEKIDRSLIGAPTKYHGTQLEIRHLDDKIKTQESYAAIESDIRTKVDAVKDRGISKLKDGKKLGSTEGFDIKKVTGGAEPPIDTSNETTLQGVYSRYKEYAEAMEGASAGASQTYQNELAAIIPNESDEARADRIQKAKERADEAARQKVAAAGYLRDLEKKAAEHAFTQIVRDTEGAKTSSLYEPGMVDLVVDMKRSVAIARNNADTVARLQEPNRMRQYSLTQNDIEAFLTGNFVDFDQLDRLQNALKDIANERSRNVSDYKDEKRQKETSTTTQAQKADADFNGGK